MFLCYLVLAVLGLRGCEGWSLGAVSCEGWSLVAVSCEGWSLVAVSGDSTPAVMCRLLVAVACLCYGAWALGRSGFSRCGSQALGHGLSSCSTQA